MEFYFVTILCPFISEAAESRRALGFLKKCNVNERWTVAEGQKTYFWHIQEMGTLLTCWVAWGSKMRMRNEARAPLLSDRPYQQGSNSPIFQISELGHWVNWSGFTQLVNAKSSTCWTAVIFFGTGFWFCIPFTVFIICLYHASLNFFFFFFSIDTQPNMGLSF